MLATALQQKRYENLEFNSNGAVPHKAIGELCNITDKAWSVLGNIFDHFHLSGRAFDRILKVARTIADLEGIHKWSLITFPRLCCLEQVNRCKDD